MRAQIAGVRFVSRRLFLLDLHRRRNIRIARFNLGLHLLDHFERVHVDVPVGAKLGAFSAADAPILDDDFKVLLPADRTDRALRHAKRIAAGAARRRDEKMIVAQAVAEQPRDAVMRFRAGLDAGIAARAIIEIDEEKILRFEQSLIEIIVEPESGRDRARLGRRHPRLGHRFELGPNVRKFFQHQVKFGARNSHHIHGIERSAGRDAFDRTQQSDFAEIIAAAQIRPHHFATGHRLRHPHHPRPN